MCPRGTFTVRRVVKGQARHHVGFTLAPGHPSSPRHIQVHVYLLTQKSRCGAQVRLTPTPPPPLLHLRDQAELNESAHEEPDLPLEAPETRVLESCLWFGDLLAVRCGWLVTESTRRWWQALLPPSQTNPGTPPCLHCCKASPTKTCRCYSRSSDLPRVTLPRCRSVTLCQHLWSHIWFPHQDTNTVRSETRFPPLCGQNRLNRA